MDNSQKLQKALDFAIHYATNSRMEFVTPELMLVGICVTSQEFDVICDSFNVDYQRQIKESIYGTFDSTCRVPEFVEEYELQFSMQMQVAMASASFTAESSGKGEITLPHLLNAIYDLEDSFASYLLHSRFTEDRAEFMRCVIDAYDGKDLSAYDVPLDTPFPKITDDDDDEDDGYGFGDPLGRRKKWRELVTCVNDLVDSRNPLIGRERELDRTVQVLCRADKNNPLHIGEPGVGKTALVYGLARRIIGGNVPERLRGAKIYQLDMGSLVAGTQYRGEFEERIKTIMKGAAKEGNAIVYIDEIHTLIGSGATGGDSLDGSNILKPYLESGEIRFIGATTYKEYNRYFEKSQGMVRRFQKIDIAEPTENEAVEILKGLLPRYETFHNVKYNEGVVEYAVRMSMRYITGRFLPDKAIDLIDEAGAFRELHPLIRKYKGEMRAAKTQRIDKQIITDTVKRICKLSDQTLEANTQGSEQLETLASRMKAQIYGQDPAIDLTTEAVMMGKAGLLEAEKPIASMLFVGPTGVGKTEVCKVLAKELGLELVRFDMSEYTEKHTVAKLIGSPAGYVGYEDGGLLTDAIRKTPNCVLLLDEIEKAHEDIYNILLQVMDYARLTDNKGQRADFQHVILIMTSNAGAQYAHQAAVGFGSQVSAGDAMLKSVKKTFKPEFLGRLSATVVFNDMDRNMAQLILNKKLNLLRSRLAPRHITLEVSEDAMALLLDKGFTPKSGAREIDRIINSMLTPLLTREILFGSLKQGGTAVAVLDEKTNKIALQSKS